MKRALFVLTLIPLVLLAGCGGGGESDGTAYEARGCGVIMESLDTARALPSGAAFILPFLKEVDPADLAPGGITAAGLRGPTRAPLDLTEYPAFFYLTWNKHDGADRYQVYYGTEIVWDSDDTHSGDPPFNWDQPEAYLDLDQANELKDIITAAGTYAFEVAALDATTEIQRYPAVTLSLGMLMEAFPGGIYESTESTGQRIQWTGVTGAGGYRVLIYAEGWGQPLEYNEVLLPSTTLSYDLTYGGYTGGALYHYKIDAHALDTTGATAEIVRDIDGFTYTTTP